MPDYLSILLRSIRALPDGGSKLRGAVYQRAQDALLRQLTAVDPPLLQNEIDEQVAQLETAIRNIEAEALAGGIDWRLRGDRIRSALSYTAQFRTPEQDAALQFADNGSRFFIKIRPNEDSNAENLRNILKETAIRTADAFKNSSNQYSDTYNALAEYCREIAQPTRESNPISLWALGIRILHLIQRNEAENENPTNLIEVYDHRLEFALRELISIHGPYILSFPDCAELNRRSQDFTDPLFDKRELSEHLERLWHAIRTRSLIDDSTTQTLDIIKDVNRLSEFEPRIFSTFDIATANFLSYAALTIVYAAKVAVEGSLGNVAYDSMPFLAHEARRFITDNATLIFQIAHILPAQYGWLIQFTKHAQAIRDISREE